MPSHRTPILYTTPIQKPSGYPTVPICVVILAIVASIASGRSDDADVVSRMVNEARVSLVKCKLEYDTARAHPHSGDAQAALGLCTAQARSPVEEYYWLAWESVGESAQLRPALSGFQAQWKQAIQSIAAKPDEAPWQYERRWYATTSSLDRLANEILTPRRLAPASAWFRGQTRSTMMEAGHDARYN